MKICIDCGREFNPPKQTRRKICGKCHYRRYQKKYQKEYISRPETKEKIYQNRKDRRDEKYALVRKIKSDTGCIDCGIKDWRVLDFDHIKNKKIGVSYLVARNYSIERILKEISKCEVRCSNCHRIKTIERKRHCKQKY